MEEKSEQSFLSTHLTSLLAIVLVATAFWAGLLYVQAQAGPGESGFQANNPALAQAPAEESTTGTVSIDDDPILGDINAPVTIVEFSDYECPFCKRHFEETHPQILKEYLDTGKVRIVFRDLPLPFHDPMATKEAVAANCARQQGGDKGYFNYHDAVFTRTSSNGNGLAEANLTQIATDLRLNLSAFNTCLEDEEQIEEIKKDIADAGAVGITGTPSFVIGKTTENGQISGEVVVGAQPYSVFKVLIDSLLNQ
jgi:protein-disulfide isomerase